MYVRLEEVLGAQVAATVMEHLPPVGWADVATKRDLDAMEDVLRRDFDALATRFDWKFEALRSDLEVFRSDVRAEMRGEINRLLLWLFPTLLTMFALALGAARWS
jgi:hypothetical protein